MDEKNKENGKKEAAKKKSKHILNAFDIVIVIIILLIITVFGMKIYNKSSSILQDTQKFYFTIEALELDKDFQEKISIGDQIRDNIHGYFYGKVSDIKFKSAKKITENNVTGEFVLSQIPDKIDIEITVECDANISDDAITVDTNPIRLGKLMSLKSKGYVVYGYIINMETEWIRWKKN